MNKGESKFWRDDLRVAFQAMGDVDRLESHATSIGRPDVNLCLMDGIVWDVELKYTDCHTVKIRPAQKMWHSKRGRAGGNSCILTKVVLRDEKFFIFHYGRRARDLDDRLSTWIETADIIWDNKIDFVELEEIFRGKR